MQSAGTYGSGAGGEHQFVRYTHHRLLQHGSGVALGGGCPVLSCESGSTSSVSDGDYQVNAHEIIASSQNVYEVLELLGRGTFGQVLRCWKKDSNETVAMKILKNLPSYTKQGQVEVDVLTTLSKVDSELFNFVHAYESFTHHGHICIVFECLQINLYDYLKRNGFQPLPLKHIRPVAQQVLTCLKKLRELGLVHADLKPENIMLVDPDRHPFRVKVIDFGSATCRSTELSTTYLQSRYYRAPEVILGVSYDEAIDLWSLGCVLAELFLGWPLFPGATEYDQISYISQMLGQPPPSLTKNSAKMSKFYRRDNRRKWVLKTPAQYQMETGVCPKEARKFILTSVSAIGQVSSSRVHHQHNGNDLGQDAVMAQHQDRLQFITLLERLLTFDPRQRAEPNCCLQHPFITMLHLSNQTMAPCVREWIECMQVCCRTRTISPPTLTPTATYLALPNLLTAYVPSQMYPSLLPLHSNWLSTDYRNTMPAHSSILVDANYMSAAASPTVPTHSSLHSPYWLMLQQQSGYLVNRSRL